MNKLRCTTVMCKKWVKKYFSNNKHFCVKDASRRPLLPFFMHILYIQAKEVHSHHTHLSTLLLNQTCVKGNRISITTLECYNEFNIWCTSWARYLGCTKRSYPLIPKALLLVPITNPLVNMRCHTISSFTSCKNHKSKLQASTRTFLFNHSGKYVWVLQKATTNIGQAC